MSLCVYIRPRFYLNANSNQCSPYNNPRRPRGGGIEVQLSTFPLISALDGGGWQTPRPAVLTPGKRHGTHFTIGWVGPMAGLDGCGKSCPPPRCDPRTVQPVASRYTDYAIHVITIYKALSHSLCFLLQRVMMSSSVRRTVKITDLGME
jgi:hypothetical protein